MDDAVSNYPGLIRSRLRQAGFGPRYMGLTMDTPGIREILEDSADPLLGPSVRFWVELARTGMIIEAEGAFDTCGKGLWFVGGRSDALACAIAQTLVIDEIASSAVYCRAEMLLDSERPEGSREYRTRMYASGGIMVLSGYGLHRLSDWSDATLDNLLANRVHSGLPTLVTAGRKPPSIIAGVPFGDAFFPHLAVGG